MKKITLLFAVSVIPILFATAQVSNIPQAVNYQAIARDANGNPYANRTISVRMTINFGVNPGFPEYQEIHPSITTNQFGLFTLKMGINWSIVGSTIRK